MIFKYLVISDIHLGHHINKTDKIINNLNKFFITYKKELKDIKAIFLAGDIYDRLLSTSSTEFILINEWLIELLIYCKANNIMLRILEGTHSHDWKQIKVLTSIINKLNISIDYRYVDDVYIEKCNKYGLNILYIPDDYRPDSKDTYNRVLEVLKENNLGKVDICIMHGQFHYQLPGITLASSHTEENYLSITKYYISIGHIHTHSVNGRILAQGSFDRLSHGEEEDKGAMLISIDTSNKDNCSYVFLKNKNSMVFKTIYIEDKTLEESIELLDTIVKTIPSGSSIRLISNTVNFNIDSIRKRYSNLTFKHEIKKLKEDKNVILENVITVDEFHITKENIRELLLKELDKYNLTNIEHKIAIKYMNEVI